MGLTYANLKLVNLLNQKHISIRALVDTGATFMCVTEEMATQLGFDVQEVGTRVVTLANGHQMKAPLKAPLKAPRIAPVEIFFENRSYVTEALVLGNEALMGVLPIEAMDLIVEPRAQQLNVNPQHPNFPVAFAK